MGKLSGPVLKYLKPLFAISERVRKTFSTGYPVSSDFSPVIFWVILYLIPVGLGF